MADTILTTVSVVDNTNEKYMQANYPSYVMEVPTKPQGAASVMGGSWDWCSHGWSAFTMVCCCWCAGVSSLFGLVGLICSIGSYADYKSGDYGGFRYKKTCAIAWTLAGIVCGLGTLGALAYVGFTYGPGWVDEGLVLTKTQVMAFIQPYIDQIKEQIMDAIPTVPTVP